MDTLFIAGRWRPAGDSGTRTIHCPADGREVVTVAEATASDARDAVAAARVAELRTAAELLPFVYRVAVTESPVPTYGGRMVGDRDRYARLEVHLVEGGQDYDIMGYVETQVIHDCLDQYERHLEFLRLE